MKALDETCRGRLTLLQQECPFFRAHHTVGLRLRLLQDLAHRFDLYFEHVVLTLGFDGVHVGLCFLQVVLTVEGDYKVYTPLLHRQLLKEISSGLAVSLFRN